MASADADHHTDIIMSRPKPTIILEHITDDLKATQVCEADGVYAVCYKGKPVSMRTNGNIEVPDYPGFKYSKTAFTNPGHAFNLAEKLNAKFNTTDFDVRIMLTGRIIREK